MYFCEVNVKKFHVGRKILFHKNQHSDEKIHQCGEIDLSNEVRTWCRRFFCEEQKFNTENESWNWSQKSFFPMHFYKKSFFPIYFYTYMWKRRMDSE